MSVLHVFAISSTIFRLSQRYTSQRMWYDDYVALLAVVTDCVYFVVLHVWTRSEPNGTTFGRETTIICYWISSVCFLLVSWPAKVSLALAIARIFPPGRTIRRFAMGMAWSFVLLGMANLLGIAISCGRDTSWHNSPQVQCEFPKILSITTFCANLIADALLVLTPLRMLWRVKLPNEQRRLILAGFAASVWASIAVGLCFVFMSGPDSWGRSRRTINFLLCHAMVCIIYILSMPTSFLIVWVDVSRLLSA
ncbi:hypothetical protein BD779DRAFT_1446869 [Infundibulicybe gibba]|nr:hypothetical protein BD779DRAFT_1446869 [Infundibulicybe gibba]